MGKFIAHAVRAGLVLAVLVPAAFMEADRASAGCTTVNGSALNNLAANETVNCADTNSAGLVSTNNGITVNLQPGLTSGVGGNFTDFVNSNTFTGSDFFVSSGAHTIMAQDGNILDLSDGHLSGDFAILLDDGNSIVLTGMEITATNTALEVETSNFIVISKSQLSGGNIGIALDNNNQIVGNEIVVDSNGVGITAGNNNIILLTDSQLTTAAEAIFTGSAGNVQLTDSSIVTSQKGIVVGSGSQIILDDTSIVSAQGGISGDVGFALIRNSTIEGGTGASIAKNGTTTVIDSALSGTTGFFANISNLSATLDLTDTSIAATTNSVFFSDVADTLVLNSGTDLSSPNGADGAAGTDNIFLRGTGNEDEVFINFENLTMEGTDWALSGTSSFTDIAVDQGRLRINGDIAATNGTIVDTDGIIGGNGNLTTPLLDVSGGVAPGNSVGTLTVTGNYLQTGGFLEIEFDESGIDLLQVTGTATLTGSPTLQVKQLGGAGGAAGTFLVAGGGLTGTFGAIEFAGNGGAAVVYQANSAELFVAQPTGVVAEDVIVLGLGERVLSILGSEQLTHLGSHNRKLWGTGIGLAGSRNAEDGNAGYDYDTEGTLFGSDLYAKDGWRFGLGGGYGNSSIDIDESAGDSDLDGAIGLAYGSYEQDKWFVLGRLMGGWNNVDSSRTIATTTDLEHASSDSDSWLLGTGVSVGANLPFPGGWKLSPRLNLDYVRQWHGDAHETGGSDGAIDIDGYSTSAFTASGLFRVGRTLDFDVVSVEPFVQVGVAQRIALGDRKTKGEFQEVDADFDVRLAHEDRTLGLVDAGTIVDFHNGVSAQLNYGGQFEHEGSQHGVMATIRASW